MYRNLLQGGVGRKLLDLPQSRRMAETVPTINTHLGSEDAQQVHTSSVKRENLGQLLLD
jgi:hypothetical protein